MTKRITVTLPDEVAATLEHLPNVSAYVTEAIVRRQRASRLRGEFEARGVPVTDDGIARMRERLQAKYAAQSARRAARSTG